MQHIIRLRLFLLLSLTAFGIIKNANAQNGEEVIGNSSGKYAFNYNELPDALTQLSSTLNPAIPGLLYQWESCTNINFENPVFLVQGSSYNFGSPLSQTTYFRRKATINGIYGLLYSNIIKYTVVSTNWEDRNYIREHTILVPGITDWKVADQLPIGSKLETTNYMDGFGRSIETISRETATPSSGTLWGDIVQVSEYDAYGRQSKSYLPYSTTVESGKFKTTALTEQAAYYQTNYSGETVPWSQISFDNSPLNRVLNIKSPGKSWSDGLGNSSDYYFNNEDDNVQIFRIGYASGDIPVNDGIYQDNTLIKSISTDENNNQVITYTNKSGQVILKKVQLAIAPTDAYNGWICTYNVYDDFGRLRYQIMPEAVKWLQTHSWHFNQTEGPDVLNGLCFRYEYDEKGRTILKQGPGAKPLRMLYNKRDAVVFTQDGNQANKTIPEWTASLYDELDRPVIQTIYKTGKSISSLQSDINNGITTALTTGSAGQPVIDRVENARPNTSIVSYTARNSIGFEPGFESQPNDQFVAEIDPNAVSSGASFANTVYNLPISAADLANPAVTTILKYQFYDDYSYTGYKTFDPTFDNTSAYATGAEVLDIAISKRTISMVTGSRVRVLGTDDFLTTTSYYDERGNAIQSLSENIKNGIDITTLQYHWDGRVVSSFSKHTVPGTGYAGFGTLTKNIFDKIGRITSLSKKIGSAPFKNIATYTYDDIGRPKTKIIDPDYFNATSNQMGLETQAFSYNIHGQLTGINKDYALKNNLPWQQQKWERYFGMVLGYDDREQIFQQSGQLDGHIMGALWTTQGDDAQRKYEYTYDNAGRLFQATFTERQKPGYGWSNSKMDFSVNNLGYDLNGNLLRMVQRGIQVGSGPVDMDDLRYTYTSFTNQVLKIKDESPLKGTVLNGLYGDFKDGGNGADANDYIYDLDGNMITDLNKNVQGASGGDGIVYNFLDKPELIRIAGKGSVKIVYDADGTKLQRVFTPDGGGSKTTTYINGYVYEQTISSSGNNSGLQLQFFGFEEGRVRIVTPLSQSNGYDAQQVDGNMDLPNGKRGAFDFYIRDQQQNTRMILTEAVHTGYNTCTMERSRRSVEEQAFGQPQNNEVTATEYPTASSGWTSNSSDYVSKIGNLAGGNIGPNSLLKVMAGDLVSTQTDYFFQSGGNNNNNNLVNNIVTALVQALGSGGTSGMLKAGKTDIGNLLSADVPFGNFVNQATAAGPKAYLNVMFFNERFEFVEENSQALPVSQANAGAALVIPNIKAPKNGYVYVYVSNQSDQPVYFDNFKVALERGRIMEENHYFAYGLKIAAISSQKLPDASEGHVGNNYLYQGAYSEFDEDLGWNDFALRNYDPQRGQWLQMDPYDQFASPYVGMGNDPVNYMDPDGGEVTTAILPGVTVLGKAKSVIKPFLDVAMPAINAFVYVSGDGRGSFLNSKDLGGSFYYQDLDQTFYRSDVLEKMQSQNALNYRTPSDISAEYWSRYNSAYAALDHANGQVDFPNGSPYPKKYSDRIIPGEGFDAINKYRIDENGYLTKEIFPRQIQFTFPAYIGGPTGGGAALVKQLVSESQMAEVGIIMARGSEIRDVPRLVNMYGGKIADWGKKTSSTFTQNGKWFETHWYENLNTGQRFEFKTKFDWVKKAAQKNVN